MGFLKDLITAGVSLIPGIGPVAAAGLAAGGQLLGGALDMRAQNKERQYAIDNRGVDFVKLRDDAIKGGFNPLTALNATGGQGYDRVAGLPSLGSAAFIGDAMSSFGKSLFDLRLQESDQLARAQLAYGLQGQRVAVETGPSSYGDFGQLGSQTNPVNTMIWYRNPLTGNIFLAPNADVMDMSPGEVLSSSTLLSGFEIGGHMYGSNVGGTPFIGASASEKAALNYSGSPMGDAWRDLTGGWQLPALPSTAGAAAPAFPLLGP